MSQNFRTNPRNMQEVGQTLGRLRTLLDDFQLNELSDVVLASLANDQLIVWDSTASQWKNKALGSISGAGESNTASNAGTGGVGITLTKAGVDLPFKSINNGDGIAITDDVGNKNVDVALNVNGLTEDTTPDGAADFVASYDASAGAHKKILLNNLPGGGAGSGDILANGTVDFTGVETFNAGLKLTEQATPSNPVATEVHFFARDNTSLGSGYIDVLLRSGAGEEFLIATLLGFIHTNTLAFNLIE